MENKVIPQLRFPEFEGELINDTLIGIAIGKLTNGIFNDPKKVGSGYYLINVKDMYSDLSIDKNNLTRINIKAEEFGKNKVQYGDVFFTRSSLVKEGIAHSAINLSNDNDITFDGHLIKLTPDLSKVRSVFLGYLLKTTTIRKQLIERGKTGTMTTIGQEDISSVKVNLPTPLEQTKIATFLTTIDKRIKLLQKKKAELEQYKKGIMQKLFTSPLSVGDAVDRGGQRGLRFKDKNSNTFPDWEEKKLGEVCDVRDGTHESPKYHSKGFPLITSKNLLKNGKLSFDDINYISEENFVSINKRSNVSVGDILFGMIGTIGNPVLVDRDDYAIKNVALIKQKDKLSNTYLIHYLNSELINRQFHKQNTGGTQKFIALGVIRDLKINTPCKEEQQKIANFLSSIDKSIENMANQIDGSVVFKQGLLQKMLV